MIIQTIIGGLVVRKLAKTIKKESDFRKLKEFGKEIGYPYIAGEDVESYRKRLAEIRDQMWIKA